MKWRVELTDPALADMDNVPPAQLSAIMRAVRLLARDPAAASIKKLKTPPDMWRLRVGNWRIFFAFDERDHILKVIGISDRKDAY